MASAQEELSRAILAVLPDLPADTLTTLMAGLEELGVENKEDMSLLSEENLLPFLRVVQSRKLLLAFSSQGNRTLGGSGSMCVSRMGVVVCIVCLSGHKALLSFVLPYDLTIFTSMYIEMFTVELVNLGCIHKFTLSTLCHTLDHRCQTLAEFDTYDTNDTYDTK